MSVRARLLGITFAALSAAAPGRTMAGSLVVTNDFCVPACPAVHQPPDPFVSAGASLALRVLVFTDAGVLDSSFAGAVVLTSSDPSSEMPTVISFDPVAGGTYSLRATLRTAGDQTITATDPAGLLESGTLTLTVQQTCAPSSAALCLGPFRVEASWGNQALSGHAVPLTATSGYFWLFESDNVELVVKVLDGCAAYDHYWFFAAGLTNVGVALRVTDTSRDVSKDYSSPPGSPFAAIQDTSAFATCR